MPLMLRFQEHTREISPGWVFHRHKFSLKLSKHFITDTLQVTNLQVVLYNVEGVVSLINIYYKQIIRLQFIVTNKIIADKVIIIIIIIIISFPSFHQLSSSGLQVIIILKNQIISIIVGSQHLKTYFTLIGGRDL